MQAYRFDPERHFIPRQLDVTTLVRKRLRNDDVVILKNRVTGSWVITYQLPHRPGFLEDLVVIGTCEDSPVANRVTEQLVGKADYLLNGPSANACGAIEAMRKGIVDEDVSLQAEELAARRFINKKSHYDDPLWAKD